MSTRLQLLLILGAAAFFFVLIYVIRKSKMSTEMALAWVILGIGIIVLSLFPSITYSITSIVGIIAPINTIYLFMIFFLFCLSFYLFVKISLLEEKLKNIIQIVSIQNDQSKK